MNWKVIFCPWILWKEGFTVDAKEGIVALGWRRRKICPSREDCPKRWIPLKKRDRPRTGYEALEGLSLGCWKRQVFFCVPWKVGFAVGPAERTVATPKFIFSYFITNIHSYNHIHTVHLSVAIRWGRSPLPHRLYAQWETPPCMWCRESNSGLPYSKPTRYQLSHATPKLVETRKIVPCSLLCWCWVNRIPGSQLDYIKERLSRHWDTLKYNTIYMGGLPLGTLDMEVRPWIP